MVADFCIALEVTANCKMHSRKGMQILIWYYIGCIASVLASAKALHVKSYSAEDRLAAAQASMIAEEL